MRTQKTPKNSFLSSTAHHGGFSIVEMLVAMFIASILMTAIMTVINNMSKGLRSVRLQETFNELNTEIKRVLENSEACKANLQGLTFNPTDPDAKVDFNSVRYYDPVTAALGKTLVGPVPYVVPNSNGLTILQMQLFGFQTSPTVGRYFAKVRILAKKEGVIGSDSSFHDSGIILTTTPSGGSVKVTECFSADPMKLGRTFTKTFDTIKEISYPAPGEFNKTMSPPNTPFPKPTSNPEVEITELRQTIKLASPAFTTVQIKLSVFSIYNPRDYRFRLRLGGLTGKLYDESTYNGLVSRNVGGSVYLSWSGEMPAGSHVFAVSAEATPPPNLTAVNYYANPTSTNPLPDTYITWSPKTGQPCFAVKECKIKPGYSSSDCFDGSGKATSKCECKNYCVYGDGGGGMRAWPTVRINACSRTIFKDQGKCKPSPIMSSSTITVFGDATGS